MKRKYLHFLSGTGLLVAGIAWAEVKPVANVDLKRYEGLWYEIGSLPQPFQRGCSCTQATYKVLSAKRVSVTNRCYRGGAWSEIQGIATPVLPSNAALTVQFPKSPAGSYVVIGLDKDYRYAVVSSFDHKALWILSRTPELAPELLGEAMATAARSKVGLAGLTFTKQLDCPSL